MDWQPIKTAPKDGTQIDLWMVDQDGNGWREADAWFVAGRDDRFTAYDAGGTSRYVTEKRDGWFVDNRDYGEPGFCDQPPRMYGLPRRETFERPTHWMPRPDPPA